jgi:hypothetical protein
MRVPSVGLTPDEREIVEEGYRLAERMLRDYKDPPSGIVVAMTSVINAFRQTMTSLYRTLVQH